MLTKIHNTATDPYFNMSLDEYVTTTMNEGTMFYFYQNRPTVVIGRHQNTLAEINRDFIAQKGIEVVRRMSGGGAVYHDLGNLNFTFVADAGGHGFDFTRFTRPVIKALDKIGIKAENNGRNDITIAGKKFSGNAQFRYKNRIMHHGTLMFDVKMEDVVQSLNVSSEKMVSKGVQSVRSRVTNISEHLQTQVTIEEFREILTATIREEADDYREYVLSEKDLQAIEKLRNDKYRTWDWVYGSSPAFNTERKARYDWGSIQVLLDINRGIITAAKIYGDFFATRDIAELENKLVGVYYKEQELSKLLNEVDVKDYLPSADNDQFLRLLI